MGEVDPTRGGAGGKEQPQDEEGLFKNEPQRIVVMEREVHSMTYGASPPKVSVGLIMNFQVWSMDL
jgi:hypothetical protein